MCVWGVLMLQPCSFNCQHQPSATKILKLTVPMSESEYFAVFICKIWLSFFSIYEYETANMCLYSIQGTHWGTNTPLFYSRFGMVEVKKYTLPLANACFQMKMACNETDRLEMCWSVFQVLCRMFVLFCTRIHILLWHGAPWWPSCHPRLWKSGYFCSYPTHEHVQIVAVAPND